MKRIILIGSGGSGKSTLARKLGEILGLPIYHLDRLFWHPNWVPTSKPEWAAIQQELCSQEAWIIDGNYGGTMDLRLQASDTILFLDLPRWICILRLLKRFLMYRGKSRPDMTEGCEEKLDREFLLWIWQYRRTRRPGILEKLEKLRHDKNVVILKSPRDVSKFFETVKQESHDRISRDHG